MKAAPFKTIARQALPYVLFALFVVYPLIPGLERSLFKLTGGPIGTQLSSLFIFVILALGLNVVVGYTGLLHLGIAAFFAIGAYTAGILKVPSFPFQVSFPVALLASGTIAAAVGLVLGAPTLRLRGDYLALVTLGFGEVVRYAIKNLEQITNGTRSLNPIPAPKLYPWLNSLLESVGLVGIDRDYRLMYFVNLLVLGMVAYFLARLEISRKGRVFVAIREDEIAASCMGINSQRVKMMAFSLSAFLAGIAGCLFATTFASTGGPESFEFNRSIIILCCLILGGVGSLWGAIVGVFVLLGFVQIGVPIIDRLISSQLEGADSPLLKFKNWQNAIFGLALILMMRFRPEGFIPSKRMKLELHGDLQPSPAGKRKK